ncbi:hypothetical protein Tsubulata_020919 [Turnera subulata]|uniref:Lipoxygenase n=1 Tax=Turnera subulata TaxID=218843 RepID=A0A9Q0JGV0_9ROSI|nr:hypothetical protein Tsubulata_020919 [Turnera subulata]
MISPSPISKPCLVLPNLSTIGHGKQQQSFPCRKQHLKYLSNYRIIRAAAAASSSSSSDKSNPPSNLSSTSTGTSSLKVKATVTVQVKVGGLFDNIGITKPLDDLHDALGTTFLLELVSSNLLPNGKEKESIKAYASKVSQTADKIKYEATFTVAADFGEVGAVLVENQLRRELFIRDIVLQGFPPNNARPFQVFCDSWAHSKYDNPSYLPSETPGGLKLSRDKELENLRGDGQGLRKTWERIYDYDTYRDLGDPDKKMELKRPVLGGGVHPYPRRCRTGRPPTRTDPSSESRTSSTPNFYVPRDEAFSEVKDFAFSVKTVSSVLNTLLPALQSLLTDPNQGFPNFSQIDSLYDYNDDDDEEEDNNKSSRGIKLPKQQLGVVGQVLPALIKTFREGGDDLLLFDLPQLIENDSFSWLRDDEFARQTLAGLNPLSIQLLSEWPLRSKLDPKVYGPPESLITAELIGKQIKGSMTFTEALEQKKLFMLDYHDILLPYVRKVRELENTTLYGSRTVFFLTEEGTLRPIAIELTRPPLPNQPAQWKQVYTPPAASNNHNDATHAWLWRLAKAHVSAHDTGYHQLISHWLLQPHFRYTMEINALAREKLINAGGIIETSFFPGKYSMELSSVVYDKLWRFDREALPADLIARGMAVEDPTAKHGVKLTIEDYPYANDGLILWDAIKEWVSEYVRYYYSHKDKVESDKEVQAWWTEVRTKGHADKKDEGWWGVLKTQDDLIQVLTTIIWVASAHHAAVNFGQYAFGGYIPNRPSTARINMPTEDEDDDHPQLLQEFLDKPHHTLLQCFPSQLQALQVMAVLDVLSSHSPDEEYIGGQLEPYWEDEAAIKVAFQSFAAKLKQLEQTIDSRNSDPNFKNRSGAGVVPYQLLKPYSTPGVTGKGVPNSISI